MMSRLIALVSYRRGCGLVRSIARDLRFIRIHHWRNVERDSIALVSPEMRNELIQKMNSIEEKVTGMRKETCPIYFHSIHRGSDRSRCRCHNPVRIRQIKNWKGKCSSRTQGTFVLRESKKNFLIHFPHGLLENPQAHSLNRLCWCLLCPTSVVSLNFPSVCVLWWCSTSSRNTISTSRSQISELDSSGKTSSSTHKLHRSIDGSAAVVSNETDGAGALIRRPEDQRSLMKNKVL